VNWFGTVKIRATRIAALVAGALVIGSLSAYSQTESAAGPQNSGRAETVFRSAQFNSAAVSANQRDLSRSPQPQTVNLDSVSGQTLAVAMSGASGPGIPHKIGFSRDIPGLASPGNTGSSLKWQPAPGGGKIAAISITSPGALGVRLGVLIQSLPAGAVLRFYAQGSSDGFVVPAQNILNTIQRNLRAGDASDDAKTYWSPYIDGPEATLELELPAGTTPDALQISVPRVLHMFESRLAAAPAASQKLAVGASGSCEVDVTCYLAWTKESNATALMEFIDTGSAYLCTGSLLNTIPTTFIPYFLSANHCISTQTAASTLETVWFFRSTSCNSGTVNPNVQTLSSGATLLYSTTNTDTSFLWLDGVPPFGAAYAGWESNTPSLGVGFTEIHHPMGDLQKITFGSTIGYVTCTAATANDTFQCMPATESAGTHLSASFSLGTVEGGSSGSGIFITDNTSGNHYLIGQLHGGSASCTATQGTAFYGRFDVAYTAALHTWLTPALVVPLALTTNGTGGGAISSTPGGIDCGSTCSASFPAGTSVTLVATPNTGSIFTGWGGACSGSTPSCTVDVSASSSVSASFQLVAPQGGYWWNPGASGTGFVIEIQGSSLFMAGFLYAANGEATWVGSTGAMSSPTQYSGPLTTYSGGQTLTGAYKAPTQNPTSPGTVAITFTGNSTATLTWLGGVIPIQRFDFGPGGAAATQPATNPQTGWWWNPAESGRGFAVEVQGGAMFFAGYMYDAQGNPIWYVATGNMSSGLLSSSELYQGTWQQFGNGQTLGGNYVAPIVVNSNVGSAVLQFTNPSAATLTLPDGRQIPFVRFVFNNAVIPDIAGNWSGSWQWSGPASNGCLVNDGGSFSMDITQSGAFFTGSSVAATGINSVNTDCTIAGADIAAGGTATGSVSGAELNISFTLPTGGGTPLMFSGTATLNNNTLTGSIVRSTGGSGSFSITKQ
jgi:hypothetical protein